MQTRFIFRSGDSRRLILIFAGWSTTPSFYRDLHAEGWDIAVVWDYSSLEFDGSALDGYESVYIIAWSMGVAAAAHAAATSLDPSRISAAFAVNGTLYPSSDEYGIPEDIFEATQATLNARNLIKFTKRMGYVPPAPGSLPPLPKEEIYIPDFEKLSFELRNVRDNARRGRLPWKRAFVSRRDRIFPPESMLKAWQNDVSGPYIVELDAPHYVHLQGIIDAVTPDTPRIADRFRKSISTYTENACAQSEIACRLSEILKESALPEIKRYLEIGPGDGLMTKRLSSLIHPEEAVFVDLYPTPDFGIAPRENHVAADAERWIIDAPDSSFDLIVSASTIQWFADPGNFFRHAARILRPGGTLLCSTFLPGNLSELDSGRPSPLIYRSHAELEEMLSRHFKDFQTSEDMITISFPDRRALLIHLKRTGVAGGSPTALPITPQDSAYPRQPDGKATAHTLTYRPLYISATKTL